MRRGGEGKRRVAVAEESVRQRARLAQAGPRPPGTAWPARIRREIGSHALIEYIELDGVLLSWAVPKGPSLDPGEKRLAVHVEDHPIEYGGFEGVIPKGQYGGGTVLLWDRGRWIPEGPDPEAAYKNGSLKFRLEGEKLHGRWALVRMGGSIPIVATFLSGSHWNDSFTDPGRIPGYQAGFGAGTSENKGYTMRLGETHVFSENVINELRFGNTDFHFGFLPVGFGTDQDKALGIPGPGGVTTANGISLIGGGDGRYIEYLGDFGQYIVRQKTMQLSDSLSWLHGDHYFKVGGTLMRRGVDFERTQFGKGFYFFSDFTATPGNVPSAGHTG